MHCVATRYTISVSKQLFTYFHRRIPTEKKQVIDDEFDVFAGGKIGKSLRWSLSNADCKPKYESDEHKKTLNVET